MLGEWKNKIWAGSITCPKKKDPLSVRRTVTDRGKGHQGRLASPLFGTLPYRAMKVKEIILVY